MDSANTKRPALGEVLLRGLKRKCPRCGEGPLFVRGIRAHERCAACGLLFQRDHGDTWLFMVITDRVPILIGVIAVFCGFRPAGWGGIAMLVIACAVPLIVTIRERQGLALALAWFVDRRDASTAEPDS